MTCDQCELLAINGIPCHEHGCPNLHSRWDPTERRWIKQRECRECGSIVDVGEECCTP